MAVMGRIIREIGENGKQRSLPDFGLASIKEKYWPVGAAQNSSAA
jgi:hypothetical protein